MDTYVILRRDAWGSGDELGVAAARSKAVGDEEMPDDIRWIRSYVLDEGGGRREELVARHRLRAQLEQAGASTHVGRSEIENRPTRARGDVRVEDGVKSRDSGFGNRDWAGGGRTSHPQPLVPHPS